MAPHEPSQLPDAVDGLVLSGGRGRRFEGRDKGLLQLPDGRRLIDVSCDRLAAQVAAVIISANRNIPEYEQTGYPVIRDRADGFPGPLEGVMAALAATTATYLCVVPVDTPFFPGNLTRRLMDGLMESGVTAAFASSAGQNHYLHALLHRDLVPSLDGFLADGGRRSQDWLRACGARAVTFEDAAAFANINTPEDLAAVSG